MRLEDFIMPDVDYVYSIQNDVAGGIVNLEKLKTEIQESAISIALHYLGTSGDDLHIYFRDELTAGDLLILDGGTTNPAGGLLAAHDGTPTAESQVTGVRLVDPDGIPQPAIFSSDGNLKVVSASPISTRHNAFTFNFCDKTTWYEGSIQVTNATLTNSGNDRLFTSAHDNWIDMTHGKVTFEDDIVAKNSNKWLVEVKVDGVTKTQSTFGNGNDGDYQVNFADGSITFNADVTGTVTASYWYADTGVFTYKPTAGNVAIIETVEVQFSKNIDLNQAMVFQIYGYAGVFAPGLGLPSTTLIPILTNKYKRADDYINESNGSFDPIPAFGGTTRGFTSDRIILRWDYKMVSRIDLRSDYGMEIRMYPELHTPFGGESATLAIYGTMEAL
jgi:hypothetical protein